MSSRLQVFLSHASADKPLARRIKERLSAFHIDVWLDEAEIRVGESIPGKVDEGMSASVALCLLVSKHSFESKWVTREFNAFIHRMMNDNVVILPCRVDGSPMPTLIRDIKYADFSRDFEEGIAEICNAIRIREEIAYQIIQQEIKDRISEVIATLGVDEPKKELQSLVACVGRKYGRISGRTKELADAFYNNGVYEGYNDRMGLSPDFEAAVNALLKELNQ